MGKHTRLFNNCLFFALIAAGLLVFSDASLAQEPAPDFNFKGQYEVRMAGILLGRIALEGVQDSGHYTLNSDILSSSIVSIFSKHTSHSTVNGTGKSYHYGNVDYDTHYTTKKKSKSVSMTYKDGSVVAEDVQPPDNRETRPAVPDEMKKGSVDPLTMVLIIRNNIAEAMKLGVSNFSLRVYDGRRLTKVNGTITKKRTITYQGKPLPVIVVGARRELLGGFTLEEIKDWSPKEPTMYMTFSDDGRFVPIRVEATFMFGTLAATLIRECGTESCLLGNQQ